MAAVRRSRHALWGAGALGGVLAVGLLLAGSAGGVTYNGWTAVASMGMARISPVAGLLGDGKVLVAGGRGPVQSSEIFDPSSDTWSTGPNMSVARAGAVAVTLADGDVFIAGGYTGLTNFTNTAEVYGPVTGFTPVSNTMSSPRYQAAATLLPDGDVLVAGGGDAFGLSELARADVYDPATNAFLTGPAAPPSMGTARQSEMMTTLADGKVLVAGGTDNGVPVASGEVYDPATNSWTAVSNSMSDPRANGGIAPLPDGDALVAGGESSSTPLTTVATTDLYDPATNAFTAGPAMSTPREDFGMVALPDGSVLAAGGSSDTGGPLVLTGDTEIFDPASGAWSEVGAMPVAATGFATVALGNGQVLEAGGAVPTAALSAQAALYSTPTVPAAPTDVSAYPQNAAALVTFVPADSRGAPITSYTVTASTGQTETTPDTRTFATVTGLTNGTPVTFTVTATNAKGTSLASAPSTPVTPTAPPATPSATTTTTPTTTTSTPPQTGTTADIPPAIRLSGVPKHLTLKQLRKGVRFSITPSKAAALAVTLLATAKHATIASVLNLTLAAKSFASSAATRRVTLVPSRQLLGHPRTATVRLVILAVDAAGSRTTVTRSVIIRR